MVFNKLGSQSSVVLDDDHRTSQRGRLMAYKGSGKKARKQSGMQIGGPSPNLSNFGAPKKSKKQDSNKVHNTKGRNNHGRSSGYGRSR